MTDSLPQNIEVEQALLGSLMVNSDTIALVRGIVQPDHFSEPLHSRLYAAICSMADSGTDATALTLKTRFAQDETMQEIGGPAYLAGLVANALPINATSHARLIRELAERRRLIASCGVLADEVSDTGSSTDYRVAAATHISEVADLLDGSTQRKHSFSLGEAAGVVCDRLDRLASGETDPNAIETGIAALDEATGGLRRGSYNVLAGRPSVGKTAVGIQLSLNVASAGHGVAYFSLEMPAISLTERAIASRLWMPGEGGIAYTSISRGELGEREARWVRQLKDDIANEPLEIDERPALTPAEIEAQSRVYAARFQRQGKRLGLIVVDHLHKMIQPGCRSQVEQFTVISARLADLAKKLDVPVLALAQLNRGVESRDDKRPTLADLRESGSIEQDADTVIFTYRDAYYQERRTCRRMEDEVDRMADLAECRNRLELIIAKNRQGPIGTVDCWSDMACNVIRDPRDFEQSEACAA